MIEISLQSGALSYSAAMTREDFEGLVRRALATLGVADQVTVIGCDVTPDTGPMTAELRVAGGSGAARQRAGSSAAA